MNNKIKILQFTKVINRYDFIDTIIRFGDKEKYEFKACTFTAHSNIESPHFEQVNVPHYALNVGMNKVGFIIALFKLVRILRREKFDIVHAHHYYEALIAGIACMLTGKTKLIVGRHYHEELYLTTKGLRLKLYLFLEKITNSIAAAIISPSTLINELLLKQGVKADKIFFVTYGFDFEANRYKTYSKEEVVTLVGSLGLEGNYLIGNFGRHHPIKGQKYLLESYSQFVKTYPGSRLVMVGDGSLHKELISLTERLGISEKVVFLGWRKDAHKLMAAMDVIVHSTLQEAFPQLMIEAMSLGKPLIICPVSGATDQVKHRKTGLIVPFKNSQKILEELIWIKENPEKAIDIGRDAKEYVFKNLDIKKVIKDYERVYERVINPIN